ncbi:DUF2889 family protein [Stella humosa]|uniref:DUF2889 family protein n=1 Tax=Stella humosa TaxID=94 RepID=A0A3N1LJF8_9PROT|nr:DUF2889 domain-containing protein [Stella humosa]ROP91154.1 DUF2889 family protein [Stella humosa]BBK34494.1 hypothetical protein STHU_51280 [Stella humosa]
MPLSTPAPREQLHTRTVECRGYRREDGLWDIEGHIVDTKTYPFDSNWRGAMPPGTPVHDMWIRLTVDDDLVVRAIEAVTDSSPFPICPDITPNFQRVIGLSIKTGWTQQVRSLLGGVEGCTHLVELLGPVATTAFQTIFPWRERQRRAQAATSSGPQRRPAHLDTCHALALDGPVVERIWPAFYTGPRAESA